MINIVNPNVEIWKQTGFDLDSIWKHIARCARVCYQSTPKNNNESDYQFLVRTIFKGVDVLHESYNEHFMLKVHGSVLEHGTVHLRFPSIVFNKYKNNHYSEVYTDEKFDYVTTNMRVLFENRWFDDLNFIDEDDSFKYYDRITVSFITDIGVSRELNRHRIHSISEESTRYCAYDKDKFGNNISIVKLPWIKDEQYLECFPEHNRLFDSWNDIDWYCYAMAVANTVYNKLRNLGWTAQQARQVLPLSTKTQVVHTAFKFNWHQWTNLRCDEVSGKVHPCMKEIANRLKSLLEHK